MDNRKALPLIALILLSLFAVSLTEDSTVVENEKEKDWRSEIPENSEPVKATLAGGCFWCIEAVYENVEGVEQAVSGYAGGNRETATYDQVKTGETNHREAVRIEYYPSIISFEEILDTFWRSIDPTDPDGQFTDRGFHYTTAIYYHNREQRQVAEESKQNLSESGKFEQPIVTKIKEFTTFFPAEEYHQNYSRKRSTHYNLYKKGSGREGFIDRNWEKNPLN